MLLKDATYDSFLYPITSLNDNTVELFSSVYRIEFRLNVNYGIRHLEELYCRGSFWTQKLIKWAGTHRHYSLIVALFMTLVPNTHVHTHTHTHTHHVSFLLTKKRLFHNFKNCYIQKEVWKDDTDDPIWRVAMERPT